jgi:rsbT co-antagonist protein RsbR
LRANAHDFLRALSEALSNNAGSDISLPKWSDMRDLLAEITRQRAVQGFSPVETATLVFSFKKPLFARLALE